MSLQLAPCQNASLKLCSNLDLTEWRVATSLAMCNIFSYASTMKEGSSVSKFKVKLQDTKTIY